MHVLSRQILGSLALAGLTVALGCGGDGFEPPLGDSVQTPTLQAASPTTISLGETLTIMGQGFGDPLVGQRTRVVFDGTYQSPTGTEQVQMEIKPEYVNAGTLTWTVGPNVPFSQQHQDVGVFRGTIRAVNVASDGAQGAVSDPLNLQVQVGPSIAIRRLSPLNQGCGRPLTETVEGTPLLFDLEAIGLNTGGETGPVIFSYTFMRENFAFDGFVRSELQTNPEDLFPVNGPVTIIDQVNQGRISVLGDGNLAGKSYAIREASSLSSGTGSGYALFDQFLNVVQLGSQFKLTHVKPAPLPDALADHVDATVLVVAVDREGRMAKRAIPLRVWSPIEVDSNDETREIRAYEPVPVSGCVPGQSPPLDLKYREEQVETREREIKYVGKIKPIAGVDGLLGLTLKTESEFGIEGKSEASSSQLQGVELNVPVLPGEFGVIYRQRIKIERMAELRQRDGCGNVVDLGQAVLTDWRWSPDLAKGRACPPFPESGLRVWGAD